MGDNYEAHVGDTPHIKLYCLISLSGYTSIIIYLNKPSLSGGRETVPLTPVEVESEAEGTIYYVAPTSTLNIKGMYEAWAVVDFADGRHFTSNKDRFRVKDVGE